MLSSGYHIRIDIRLKILGYHSLFLFLVPVTSNFSEEDTNSSLLTPDTLEYPLQRDEVQTIHSKDNRSNVPQSKHNFTYI